MFHVISARQAFSLVLSVLPFHLVKPFQAKQTLLQQHCALPPGSRSRQPGLGQRASTAKPPMGISTGWGRLLPALHRSLEGLCPPDTPRATWQGSPAPPSPSLSASHSQAHVHGQQPHAVLRVAGHPAAPWGCPAGRYCKRDSRFAWLSRRPGLSRSSAAVLLSGGRKRMNNKRA